MFEFIDYAGINKYSGLRSTSGTVENDLTTAYFMRSLFQRAISTIRFTLPETWDENYFRQVLFRAGFIGVVETAKYGIIPQICTLSGYGLYMQPTRILVAQPLVQFDGTIGKDCELIRLTPDYLGIWDICEHYAVQLSMTLTSVKMSEFNSRLAYIVAAKSKRSAETAKVIFEKIMSGEPLVVTDKNVIEDDPETGNSQLFTEAFDVKNSFVLPELLDSLEQILRQFDREIGIPAIDNKKERMIDREAQLTVSDTFARLRTWEDCLTETFERTNRLFPELGLSFEIRKGEEYVDTSDADIVRGV